MLNFRDVRRRIRIGLWLVLSILALGPPGRAEDSKSDCLAGQRVRFIIPHPVGGGYDTYYRMFTPFLARHLGADVTVENVEGSGGVEGATVIRDAKPDGKTIGSLNGGGMLCAALSGDTLAPNPLRDFTILARAARSRHVWLADANSKIKSMEDVLAAADKKPIVFGLRDVGSTSFGSITLGAALLDLPYDLVTGYKGSRDAILGALRDEVQLVSYNFDSVEDQVRNGELRPILQISDEPIADTPLLAGVPLLGGPDGWAVRRAGSHGGDADAARQKASSLDELLGAGRLVVAPPGMDPALAACLEDAVYGALKDPEFQDAARKAAFAVEPARGPAARQDIEKATNQWDAFMPIIRAAIQKVRE